MKRQNISPKILHAESRAITQFLFDRAIPCDASFKLPVYYVFDAYVHWRREQELPKTRLSLDGFGRLFPHTYPRRTAYWKPVGHCLNCVFGLGLK